MFSSDEIVRACELMSLAAPVSGYSLMEFDERSRRRIVLRLGAAVALGISSEILFLPREFQNRLSPVRGDGGGSEMT